MRYDLCVVGAGGTGTYFLKEVGRFLSGRNTDISSIHIFDGDIVEEKNLTRQCFLSEDIGRNKASVMGEILSDAFNLNVYAHPIFIKEANDLKIFKHIPIIVSCVDNHGARLILEEFFENQDDCILLDSGNEFTTGEVVMAYKLQSRVYGPPRSYYFPEIKKGDTRNVTELSCEELNKVTPQHIFTNMLAGNILCSAISNLLSTKITPGVVFFNALNFSMEMKEFKKGI
ncbi:MAG: ThiF family adenylyltransferase [Lachnospiraceae bacterium]|nr:ThiF family adenylyltransferase [Lachnospiraceae bacterium]